MSTFYSLAARIRTASLKVRDLYSVRLQIVHAEAVKEGVFSSFVQMRGSIPTFWMQKSSISTPKPDIVNSRVDPLYSATQVYPS